LIQQKTRKINIIKSEIHSQTVSIQNWKTIEWQFRDKLMKNFNVMIEKSTCKKGKKKFSRTNKDG
jgi:hypothetical protein